MKMKFVSIVGQLEHFDKFVSNHIIDSNIHLENAMNIITLVRGLKPFPGDETTGGSLMKTCEDLLDFARMDRSPAMLEPYYARDFIPLDVIERKLTEISEFIKIKDEEYRNAVEKLREYGKIKDSLDNILNINVNIEKFFDLEFVKFRFGKIPLESLKALQIWADELEMIMIPLSSDEYYSWLIYFTPAAGSDKVDGIVSSMQFERTWLSSELTGTPQDALESVNNGIAELEAQITELNAGASKLKEENGDELMHMYYSLVRINRNQEVRRNAVCTDNSFYLCGWIPEEDLPELASAIKLEEGDSFIEEEPSMIRKLKPPTELKNPGIFRLFEVLVKMYGLPSYHEIDPTPIVAITYFLMFGIMFGDVGQGLIIMCIGLILYRRRFSLAGVFVSVGISSCLFGLIYGSFFGNEQILPALYGLLSGTPGAQIHLIRPMEDKMTMLLGGVVIGVVFMTVAVALNIVNGIKEKNIVRVLFDRNGAAGTLLYWSILLTVVVFALRGPDYVPFVIIIPYAAIMFLLVFLKEPLERLILEHKNFLPKEKGLFFVQGLFEMVETLLSMASNTLSFIRVGAFALNHVGLFLAFNILSRMAGNIGGIFVSLFANALIIGLEGLIVGIQCLRLEYYELFSRFYKGDGKPYKPLSGSIK